MNFSGYPSLSRFLINIMNIENRDIYSITLKNFVFLTKLLIEVMGCLGCEL